MINQNDISNVTRHSERSEESPELSNSVHPFEFFNCHPELVSGSINLISQNDISNATRHSERSEESPELSDSTSESKVIARSRIECGMTKGCHSGNPVIASPSGRGNPIKSTSNAIEPMGLLRRFVPHNDRLKKCAFTLAEIMITIGIVGVVAAITIPTLIQNSNSKKFSTLFKKELSTLNQAAISAQAQYDMDYGSITSESAPSTCGSDTFAASNSTMCALFNSTLSAKNYMGVYGEVGGSIFNSKYQFTKKTDGFDPTNFLLYTLADGSIVGFNPNAKRCSLESGQTINKSILTDENGLKNCIGFIDVNGVSLPNKEVTCADGTSSLDVYTPCTLKTTGSKIGDVYPIVFHNGTVEPATNAGLAQIGALRELTDAEKLAKRRQFDKWVAEPVLTPMSEADCNAKKASLGIQNCRPGGDDYFAAAAEKCGGVQNLPTVDDLYELSKTIYGESNCNDSTKRCDGTADFSKLPESFSGLGSSWERLWSGHEISSIYVRERAFYSSSSTMADFHRHNSTIRAVCVGDLK